MCVDVNYAFQVVKKQGGPWDDVEQTHSAAFRGMGYGRTKNMYAKVLQTNLCASTLTDARP
jgi:hypothetical protein